MEIRKIQGISPEKLMYLVDDKVRLTRFTANVELIGPKIKVREIRLREKKPYCGNHPNACEVEGGNRKGNWLEGADWVSWNDFLNDICDSHNISASIVSNGIVWVRRGFLRRINYGSHIRMHFWEWDYVGEDGDYENCCGKVAMDSSYPFGTPGDYSRELAIKC